MEKPILHIVHCIDTEGPLDEDIYATFERLNYIFGIKLIKIVGFVGIFLGLIILSSFWFWVIKMLYKVG